MRKLIRALTLATAAGWEHTVRHMAAKGAKLSPENQDLVIEYLRGLPSGAGPVCQ